jgi:hypothetical protein
MAVLKLLYGSDLRLKKIKSSSEIIKLSQRGGEYQSKLRKNFYGKGSVYLANETQAATK